MGTDEAIETTKTPINITLRPFQPSDVHDFLEWAGDEKVTKYCRWNTFTSEEEATNFLNEVISSHPYYRAICVNETPVGSIYVNVTPETGKDQRRGEIGYALSSRYWGLGIATTAVEKVMSGVFNDLPYLDRIEGLVYAENMASQRVLEKAGFLKEGLLRKYFFVKGKSRDIVVFSVVANDHP